ncbi:MAG: [protein-PII] uridylyltransferase family protein [Armatimonadota bacterium]
MTIQDGMSGYNARQEILPHMVISAEWLGELQRCDTAVSVGQWLAQYRSKVMDSSLELPGGLSLCRIFTALVDSCISRLYDLAINEAGIDQAPQMCVVATGGYGRLDLCAHSDIDVTFIPARDAESSCERVIRSMYRMLIIAFMDNAKMTIGYAYRLIDDCGSLDHGTQTNLVDARIITGSRHVFARFLQEYWSQFNAADFVFRKIAERNEVTKKFGISLYSVEPHLKEAVGGLRDIHMIRWLGAGRACVTTGGDWVNVAGQGLIDSEDVDILVAAHEFITTVRNHLHILAGEERDILTAEKQDAICQRMGYQTQNETPAVELFMREFYTHSAHVCRISRKAQMRAKKAKYLVGLGLDVENEELIPNIPLLQMQDLSWMIQAVSIAQEYELNLSERLTSMIRKTVAGNPDIRSIADVADEFFNMLRRPHSVCRSMRMLSDTGLLGWILPEFEYTMALIPYDPSHEFTVGEHSLRVLQNIEKFQDISDHNYMDYRRILQEIPNQEAIYMAALLHDIGKARMGDHCINGVLMCRKVCARLLVSEEVQSDIEFIIDNHLLMAETSRMFDLNLDETIATFCKKIETVDRLNLLYLFTYADEKAVAPGLWSEIKANYQRDLYKKSVNYLTEGLNEDSAPQDIGRYYRRLVKDLQLEKFDENQVKLHLEEMSAAYLLNTPQEVVALHIKMASAVADGRPQIAFHTQPGSDTTELIICTPDDPLPGLMAKIAGVFYAAGCVVHNATVYTRIGAVNIAIDTFIIDYRGRAIQTSKRSELEQNLTDVLTGAKSVEELIKQHRRRNAVWPELSSVTIRHDLAKEFSVVEIRASDTPGILFWASRGVSKLGWNIYSAKLSMWAGNAVVVFYVQDLSDMKGNEASERLRPILNERDIL